MKSKGVTTQMKALDGYFLMVDWCSQCCRTELMFLQILYGSKRLKSWYNKTNLSHRFFFNLLVWSPCKVNEIVFVLLLFCTRGKLCANTCPPTCQLHIKFAIFVLEKFISFTDLNFPCAIYQTVRPFAVRPFAVRTFCDHKSPQPSTEFMHLWFLSCGVTAESRTNLWSTLGRSAGKVV